jgi:hypothetical protein
VRTLTLEDAALAVMTGPSDSRGGMDVVSNRRLLKLSMVPHHSCCGGSFAGSKGNGVAVKSAAAVVRERLVPGREVIVSENTVVEATMAVTKVEARISDSRW